MVCELIKPKQRATLSQDELLRRKRERWKRQAETRKLGRGEFKRVLHCRDNCVTGVREVKDVNYYRLKLEMDIACDKFLAKRGIVISSPYRNYTFGKGQ